MTCPSGSLHGQNRRKVLLQRASKIELLPPLRPCRNEVHARYTRNHRPWLWCMTPAHPPLSTDFTGRNLLCSVGSFPLQISTRTWRMPHARGCTAIHLPLNPVLVQPNITFALLVRPQSYSCRLYAAPAPHSLPLPCKVTVDLCGGSFLLILPSCSRQHRPLISRPVLASILAMDDTCVYYIFTTDCIWETE